MVSISSHVQNAFSSSTLNRNSIRKLLNLTTLSTPFADGPPSSPTSISTPGATEAASLLTLQGLGSTASVSDGGFLPRVRLMVKFQQQSNSLLYALVLDRNSVFVDYFGQNCTSPSYWPIHKQAQTPKRANTSFLAIIIAQNRFSCFTIPLSTLFHLPLFMT